MEICRGAYNYALQEIKDWCDSRKCLTDRCSLEKEYILSPGLKFSGEIQELNNLPRPKNNFPKLGEVPSQVLQQAIKQLHVGWKYFQQRRFGFPRFKKFGQFKSLLFPQFKENPVTNFHNKLPKIGATCIQAHALCDVGNMVFMEDLDYRTSAKGMFGKHMLDAAFGQFRSIVKYVCWKRGKFFAEVDARGTTQQCLECSSEVKKDLIVRVHDCPHCGYKTDRDVAAGQNIRNRGIVLILKGRLG